MELVSLKTWLLDDANASLEEVKTSEGKFLGTRIIQDGCTYIARNWELTKEVKDILECTGMNLKPTEEKMYDLTELTYDKNVNWFDVFVVDYEECLYIREMLSYGEKLSKDARVKLSTIHAAKGGEAENVLLILDNTKTIRESAEKNEDKADEENRVWYVGVTRTKQNLYIMSARKEDRGYDIESLG